MNLWYSAATLFSIGKAPIAPGFAGSLATLILWLFLPMNWVIQGIIIIFLVIFGVFASGQAAIYKKEHDPSEVVIDEAAGMGIALFMLPHSIGLYIGAFILFRIFDVLKPSIIHRSQNLPGGWGIMIDDVLAGLLTLLILTGIQTLS
jgi:phosphatidylglycerophosphatase A